MDLQQQIGEWSATTFPHRTASVFFPGLLREVWELERATIEGEKEYIAEEAADCLIWLMSLAHFHGFDLLEVTKAKHETNLSRKWGEPDADGVCRHEEGE